MLLVDCIVCVFTFLRIFFFVKWFFTIFVMEFRALWWLQYSVFANSRFGLSVCKLHTKILALITMNYEHFLTPFKLKFKQKFFWATNALPCSRICFEKKYTHMFSCPALLTTYHPNLTKRTKFSWNYNSQKEILQFHEAMNVMFTAKWKSVKNGKIQGLKSIFLKQISNEAITHYEFWAEPVSCEYFFLDQIKALLDNPST